MNALIDQNTEGSGLAVLNTDTVQGQHLVRIAISESNSGMKTNSLDTISFTMVPVGKDDENYRYVLMWEGTDGLPFPFVANAAGEVLVDVV